MNNFNMLKTIRLSYFKHKNYTIEKKFKNII